MRRRAGPALGAAAISILAGACSGATPARAAHHSTAATAGPTTPLGRPYTCAPGVNDAIQGTYGDAAAIGWEGNDEGVVACLGGSFYVQGARHRTYGYGVYDDSKTTWTNLDGYLPALTTSFHRFGAAISITNFGDELSLGDRAFVAVYSRVAVHNPTSHGVRVDPEASSGLVSLSSAPVEVPAHGTVDHDYVVAVDRFGRSYQWPTDGALAGAGTFDQHLAQMRAFWNGQLATITQLRLPDPQLVDAYRSGFIYTQIARSGDHLNTGVNGYQSEFSHDVVGILANLFTQGDFADAQALLTDARSVVGAQLQYEDGEWTYSWPWAIYLLKTGDLAFVRANFSTEGPTGASEPSIEDTAHAIAAARTGPGGIMHATDDIDTNGLWSIDDYEALMGLAAYRYLAQQVGDVTETTWATQQYDSLLAATNSTLDATINRYHLDYLPCSIVQPNTANRCNNPEDANWAAPLLFGRWAWDGSLFGAQLSGPGIDLIDATYAYGFGRLKGELPANTFGGYPVAYYYSTGYNAGYGSWGLAGQNYRDQGILSYQFMIDHTQSGPYSWWESSDAPEAASPWIGSHPAGGQGAAPHGWGIANANKVLLDSLAAQRSDGSLLIGRGVPDSWVRDGQSLAVSNFPTTDGHRLGFTIAVHGGSVTLHLDGDAPSGPVLFELPAFVDNIATSDAGTVDDQTGVVTCPPGVTTVTVTLSHPV
ncbi:MAG TPA: hypothetical protein VII76_04360 [Acidimicrobiales bacterium]